MIPRCLGTRGDAGPRMSSPLYRSVCGGEDEHEVLRLRERDAMHFTMRLQRSLRAEINVIRPRVTWTKMQMIVSCYTARLSSHLYGKDAALSPVETLTVAAHQTVSPFEFAGSESECARGRAGTRRRR